MRKDHPIHYVWAVPFAIAINLGLLLIIKPKSQRRGSKVVTPAGFPKSSDPCDQHSWRNLLYPIR
jgi:hypothetical protein